MRFGIFYEHQLPRPWTPGLELKLFQDALDQVELADKLGLDNVWEVEHHFLEEYSHSSAPVAATWSTVSALTVAAVPTGMKAGRRKAPRGRVKLPVRAAPSRSVISKTPVMSSPGATGRHHHRSRSGNPAR